MLDMLVERDASVPETEPRTADSQLSIILSSEFSFALDEISESTPHSSLLYRYAQDLGGVLTVQPSQLELFLRELRDVEPALKAFEVQYASAAQVLSRDWQSLVGFVEDAVRESTSISLFAAPRPERP